MSYKVTTTKDLTDNVYAVKIEVPEEDITSVDKDLIEGFGEPKIQVGGTVTGTTNVVSLPPAERKVPSGFPVSQSFDGGDYTDAEDLANVWAADVLARIAAEITTLRTNSDGFTGEASVTI